MQAPPCHRRGMRSPWPCAICCTARVCDIKQKVLLLLVVQNVSSILCMKHASRQKTSDGQQALAASIVTVSEAVKVTICLGEIAVRYCHELPCSLRTCLAFGQG